MSRFCWTGRIRKLITSTNHLRIKPTRWRFYSSEARLLTERARKNRQMAGFNSNGWTGRIRNQEGGTEKVYFFWTTTQIRRILPWASPQGNIKMTPFRCLFYIVVPWLDRQDSNLRMLGPKPSALPLGDGPIPNHYITFPKNLKLIISIIIIIFNTIIITILQSTRGVA